MRAGALPLLPVLMLSGLSACDSPAFRGPVDPVEEAALQPQQDERLPAGFTAARGQGGIRDLSISTENGVTVAAFATLAPVRAVITYYRREAEAAGMTYTGGMEAADMQTINLGRQTGDPFSVSITALKKGEFTNVTLMFNVSARPSAEPGVATKGSGS